MIFTACVVLLFSREGGREGGREREREREIERERDRERAREREREWERERGREGERERSRTLWHVTSECAVLCRCITVFVAFLYFVHPFEYN